MPASLPSALPFSRKGRAYSTEPHPSVIIWSMAHEFGGWSHSLSLLVMYKLRNVALILPLAEDKPKTQA